MYIRNVNDKNIIFVRDFECFNATQSSGFNQVRGQSDQHIADFIILLI